MTPQHLVDFIFSRPWIHAGTTYAADEHARVTPGAADMLEDMGAGKRAKTGKDPKRASAPKKTEEKQS